MTTQYINNISDGTNTYVIQDPNAAPIDNVIVTNKRDGSNLPIWQGTQVQWEQGENTTWYYWKTTVNFSYTTGSIGASEYWNGICYGDGKFITYASGYLYQSSNGRSWSSLTSNVTGFSKIAYGNGKFVMTTYGTTAGYSTDASTWTTFTLPTANGLSKALIYGGDRFVAIGGNTGRTSGYSLDGTSWTTTDSAFSRNDSNISGQFKCLTYGNGKFVLIHPSNSELNLVEYSTDGINWTPVSLNGGAPWYGITYGNGKFVAIGHSKSACSSDATSWTTYDVPTLGMYANWTNIEFINGYFLALGYSSPNTYAMYSTDGINWSTPQVIYSEHNSIYTACSDEKCVAIMYRMNISLDLSFSYESCYTTDSDPTTSSTVYSAPSTTSALTVSSVTSGAITLSDNNTYYYDATGNQNTYRTIGEAHPDYLCFITNVGVKIGNTNITPLITTSITSSSTDTEVPSAKAVYDKIEESNS